MFASVAQYKNMILRKIYAQRGIGQNILDNLSVVETLDRNAPLSESEYVVFDTELTGLQPRRDSIVSLGAVKMRGGRIDMGSTFYRVVEPRTKLTGRSVLIHGITPTEASECPSIEVLLPEFLEFCGRGIVVGHFVSIDMNFINTDMKRLYGFPMQNPAVDTFRLYKWLRDREEDVCAYHQGGSEDVSLAALAEKFSIPVSGAHNAIMDAFVTAQLFQRLISFLQKFGVSRVGDLLKIGVPLRR